MSFSFSNTSSLTVSNFWEMPRDSQSSFQDSPWIQPTSRRLIGQTICPLLVSSCALLLPRFPLKFFFSSFVSVTAQAGPSHVAPTIVTGVRVGATVPATGEDDEEQEDNEDNEEDEGEVKIINQRIIAPSPPFSRIATRSQGSLHQHMEVVTPTHNPCIYLIGPESPPPSTPKRCASSCRGCTSSRGKAPQARVASPPSPSATSPSRGPKLPSIHDLVPNIDSERVQIISDHLQNLPLVSLFHLLS